MANKKTPRLNTTNYPLGWGAKQAIWGAIIIYFVAQVVVAIFGAAIAMVMGKQRAASLFDDNLWLTLAFTSVSAIVMLGLIFGYLKKQKLSFKNLGFKKPKASLPGYVLLFWIIYMVIGAILIAIASLLPGFDADQQQDLGFKSAAGWQLAVAFVCLVVIPPLAEEIVFRGFLYRGLSRGWNAKQVITGGLVVATIAGLLSYSLLVVGVLVAAVVVCVAVGKKNTKLAAALFTSVIFGLVHAQWNLSLDTFALSLMLIALYEKTNNLWACVGLHALKNFTAFVALFVFGHH
jgi:membrane protease YdiL (CAAX protease family)